MSVQGPVLLEFFTTPLNTGLTNKNGNSHGTNCEFSIPRNQLTLYVGENFSLQVNNYFKLARLINDFDSCGFVTTNFLPARMLRSMELTSGGKRIMTVPNAGGSSVISEVLSFEMLARCFNASLKKTEMEVKYFPYGGSITDYVCEVFDVTVGVSVTRAMKFAGKYDQEDALRLLNKKLKGVNQASRNSLEPWDKQILHVWSTSRHITRVLASAYNHLDAEIKTNTVVMVTTAVDADYIFNNG